MRVSTISGNDKYIEILEAAVEMEKDSSNDYWRLEDVNASGGHLNKLKAEGLVETVIEPANKANWYKLSDREGVESILDEIDEEMDSSDTTVTHDWDFDPPEFESIVGLDDVKFILRKALTAEKRVNVLLAGPPSVAKSILLMEIEEAVPNAEYGYGSEDTAAGVIDMLFEKQPQVLLIDELDEMDKEDYSVIEQLGEYGRVTERKYGKAREIELDTRIISACNDLDAIPDPVKSRFQTMQIDPYTEDEFLEVIKNVLQIKEDCNAEVAGEIAERVYYDYGSNDIRDAIRIARMVDDPEEVDRVIDALGNHAD